MSLEVIDPDAQTREKLRTSIESAIPEAAVEIRGGGGHFEIKVVSGVFEGKSRLQKQRLVYSAIDHLIRGENAPVHAVDRLETLIP